MTGCAPSQPASCPVPLPSHQSEIEQAIKRLDESIKALEKVQLLSDQLLGGLMTPEVRKKLEEALEQAEEHRHILQETQQQ